MKNQLKKSTLYKIGVTAQIAIIGSMITLEVLWGASVQQDLLRGIYCLFFFAIFAIVMFDLYFLNSRNNKLKTTGPFKFSRHPVYVCLFMISLSYWFAESNSLVPIIILQIILWSGLVIASLVQEKVILEKYGKSAQDYYSKTPRFLFF
jgi:protein-S-isoprenylcysteine O-methyltransferase Ste14